MEAIAWLKHPLPVAGGNFVDVIVCTVAGGGVESGSMTAPIPGGGVLAIYPEAVIIADTVDQHLWLVEGLDVSDIRMPREE